jgi:hypothetical protein
MSEVNFERLTQEEYNKYVMHLISASNASQITIPSKETWLRERLQIQTPQLQPMTSSVSVSSEHLHQAVYTATNSLNTPVHLAPPLQTQMITTSAELQLGSTTSTPHAVQHVLQREADVTTNAQDTQALLRSRANSILTETTTTKCDDSVTAQALTHFFFNLFKVYSVANAKPEFPSHLTPDCMALLKKQLEEAVYHVIKDVQEVRDRESGDIIFASIEYQDYQRACGIEKECKCFEKYKVPHFFYSIKGVHYTRDDVDNMTEEELMKARKDCSLKISDDIIHSDKNKVSVQTDDQLQRENNSNNSHNSM